MRWRRRYASGCLDPEGAATLRAEKDAKKLEIEGVRLEKRDGVEKRKKDREEGTKAEKVLADAHEQAKTEALNEHLELQVGRAVRRSWMK